MLQYGFVLNVVGLSMERLVVTPLPILSRRCRRSPSPAPSELGVSTASWMTNSLRFILAHHLG